MCQPSRIIVDNNPGIIPNLHVPILPEALTLMRLPWRSINSKIYVRCVPATHQQDHSTVQPTEQVIHADSFMSWELTRLKILTQLGGCSVVCFNLTGQDCNSQAVAVVWRLVLLQAIIISFLSRQVKVRKSPCFWHLTSPVLACPPEQSEIKLPECWLQQARVVITIMQDAAESWWREGSEGSCQLPGLILEVG